MVKQFNKEKLSITLDYDIYEKLVELAEKDDRSVSSMINKTLRESLMKQEGEK
jgi:predicted transcriptional regulator